MDYVLQGAINGVDRLYFHQGTIGNCVNIMLGSVISKRSDMIGADNVV